MHRTGEKIRFRAKHHAENTRYLEWIVGSEFGMGLAKTNSPNTKPRSEIKKKRFFCEAGQLLLPLILNSAYWHRDFIRRSDWSIYLLSAFYFMVEFIQLD